MPHLRIQFGIVGTAHGGLGAQVDDDAGLVIGGTTLEVGPAATPANQHPAVPDQPCLFASLTALGAAVYVAVGSAPDPAAEPRYLILSGETIRIPAPGGARVAAVLAEDIPAASHAQPLALVSAVSPQGTAGRLDSLSLNPRGALRVVQQNPDGTDIDTTAPQRMVPAGSGSASVAQVSVTNGTPAAPALAANAQRRAMRIHVPAGGPNVFWGPTGGVTIATGFRIPAGVAFEVLPHYTGDVFLIADAAGPVAVSIAQTV